MQTVVLKDVLVFDNYISFDVIFWIFACNPVNDSITPLICLCCPFLNKDAAIINCFNL